MTDVPFDPAVAAGRLAVVPGVVAVVLGGSRARGTAHEDSDWDIGVYYEGGNENGVENGGPLDLAALERAARELDDEKRPDLIAPPGAWGRWVDGGGWLVVGGRRVDILLRDFARVRQSVADSLEGRVSAHYQTGHPHACLNVLYAGELAIAEILSDTSGNSNGSKDSRGAGVGRLAALKEKTAPYPEALRRAIVRLFGFEAGFSLMFVRAYADSGDDCYVAGHVFRSLSCLNQVLFAVNGEYLINEKKAVPMADGFSKKPRDYRSRVHRVVALAGNDNAAAADELAALVEDVRGLSE